MQKIKLPDIAEIYQGLSYRRFLADDGDNFKVIVQKSIKKDGQFSDFKEVKLKGTIKHRYFSQKNDILMKIACPNDVVCIKTEDLIIGDAAAIIRVKDNYNPQFIAHLLNNTHIKNRLSDSGKLKHTSLKAIKKLQLVIPDEKTQDKYAQLLNTINEKIIEDKKQIEFDRHLKDVILNELLEELNEIK